MEVNRVHIGKVIQQRMVEEGRSVSWLAKKLHCSRENVYKIYRKSSINSEQLLCISRVLNYNFFEVYAKSLISEE